ncbi:uncharacterized protein [Drosophila kikkawai]|uniref:Endonuclease/exonuclease/phosphatase domain-containing protein n=1 Tax=Drosophila kikkawai TaxID=30033 RepID=A0ABM4GCL9_DROKI
MAHDRTALPEELMSLVEASPKDQKLLMGADTNAHHCVWGSPDINDRAGKCCHMSPKDYRPISLTSFLLKTLEKLLDLYIRNDSFGYITRARARPTNSHTGRTTTGHTSGGKTPASELATLGPRRALYKARHGTGEVTQSLIAIVITQAAKSLFLEPGTSCRRRHPDVRGPSQTRGAYARPGAPDLIFPVAPNQHSPDPDQFT